MAYVNYNRALYRTGFRPYGQTNAWAASQLNGYSVREAAMSGYLGQSHPFTDAGGWRLHGVDGLGQNRPFAPWVLHGLAQGSNICLDESENTIACASPDCRYGDCGASGWQVVSGPLCLDDKENATACGDPSCKYGDCIGPAKVSPGVLNLPPGPSGRVGVPISQFPPTSPQAPTQLQPAWMKGTIIQGVPDLLLYGFAAIAAITFIGGASGGRRR